MEESCVNSCFFKDSLIVSLIILKWFLFYRMVLTSQLRKQWQFTRQQSTGWRAGDFLRSLFRLCLISMTLNFSFLPWNDSKRHTGKCSVRYTVLMNIRMVGCFHFPLLHPHCLTVARNVALTRFIVQTSHASICLVA